jgi:MarR family transcriptional regulator, organic hydroperoxide resistance regulator
MLRAVDANSSRGAPLMRRMMSNASLHLDNQLCFSVYAASRAMALAYRPLLEPLGLTYPQYVAMLVLWEGDGVSLKQLGQRLQLDSGTLTPLIKRLEQRGLVRRERSSADERALQLRLTEAGLALEAEASEIPAQLLCRLGLGSLDELNALRSTLQSITRSIRSTTPDEAEAPQEETA